MHKHFRMVSISQYLRNHGYTSLRDDHTRIPHIWEKLRKLYNLESLDERVCVHLFLNTNVAESAFKQENFINDSSSENNDQAREIFYQFKLPFDEFGEMMFAKRLKPEGSFSPPSLLNQPSGDSDAGTRRPSTIDDTDGKKS